MSDARPNPRAEQRRPIIVGGLVIALLAIGAGSLVAGGSTQAPLAPRPATVVASEAAESSQFTCGGFTLASGSTAPATISMVNTASSAVSVTVTVVSDAPARATTALTIAVGATAAVRPGDVLRTGRWAAATVLVHGGGVAVTERIDGPNGVADSPCSSTTSSHWYFTGNSSSMGQNPVVTLVNPSSTPAVAGVSFITASVGAASPQATQGLVVGPRAVISVPVAGLVPHGGDLATMVQVTQGSLVAFMTQLSTSSPTAAAVSLGEPSLEPSWALPRAHSSPGASAAVEVANPTSVVQVVTVRVRLESGWVAPWTVSVDPFTIASIPMSPSSRVPAGSVYAARVTASGPGVAAFLSSRVTGASTSGWGITPLVDQPTQSWGSWVLPAPAGVVRSGLSLFNGSSTPVIVVLERIVGASRATAGQGGAVTVGPNSVVALGASHLKGSNAATLVVSASGPLSAAQSFFGADPGVGLLNAMPLG